MLTQKFKLQFAKSIGTLSGGALSVGLTTLHTND